MSKERKGHLKKLEKLIIQPELGCADDPKLKSIKGKENYASKLDASNPLRESSGLASTKFFPIVFLAL